MAKNEIHKQTEAKLRAYYESLIIRDRLSFKHEKLQNEKRELTKVCERYKGTISEEDYNKTRERLVIVNAQLSDTEGNMRFLETEHADTQYALGTLTEEERRIIEMKYKHKKTYVAIGYEMFMSNTRVCQKRGEILNYLYGILY